MIVSVRTPEPVLVIKTSSFNLTMWKAGIVASIAGLFLLIVYLLLFARVPVPGHLFIYLLAVVIVSPTLWLISHRYVACYNDCVVKGFLIKKWQFFLPRIHYYNEITQVSARPSDLLFYVSVYSGRVRGFAFFIDELEKAQEFVKLVKERVNRAAIMDDAVDLLARRRK
jgi:hypothetical protein